jgi:hypothetical protein
LLLITTPAKRLELEKPYPQIKVSQPRFLKKTNRIEKLLKTKSVNQLVKLFDISSNLAEINRDRFSNWKEKHSLQNSRPSGFTFNGDVHREIHVYDYNKKQLEFMNTYLRVISGFYGVLRPFDLMQPYRLPMGTKLNINKEKSLYKFWGSDITDILNKDIQDTNSKYLIDLASKEYSKSVNFKKINAQVIHIGFRQIRKDGLKNVGILNKKSRGLVIDFIIRNNIKTLEELKKFDVSGYNLHKVTDETIIFKTDKL